jgi:uncharacterized protein (DUF433 family)
MYQLSEVARYLHLPVSTLRDWVEGRSGKSPAPAIISRSSARDPRLSFNNLVEAHVLRALRHEHKVSMQDVRRALENAQSVFGIKRLLIDRELHAAPGEMFLREYGRLLSLTKLNQLAMEEVLQRFLRRVVRDVEGLPIRLYPFVAPGLFDDRRVITIDPRLSYGRPSLVSKGVSTAILAERVNEGESIEELADYYGLDEQDVKEAIVYEGLIDAAQSPGLHAGGERRSQPSGATIRVYAVPGRELRTHPARGSSLLTAARGALDRENPPAC